MWKIVYILYIRNKLLSGHCNVQILISQEDKYADERHPPPSKVTGAVV